MPNTSTENATLNPPELAKLWQLEGRCALITGASRGIGQAVAAQLLERGADVLLIARGLTELESSAQVLRDQYPQRQIHVQAADLSQEQGRSAIVECCQKHFSQLDILINNVGSNIRKSALAYSTEELQHLFQTNLFSAFELSRQLYPLLQAVAQHSQGRRQASIVNISSVASLCHLRTGAPYAMTKAALNQLGRNLAVEWASAGIRVNTVAPWYIATPLAAPVLQQPEYLREVLARTPLRRIGQSAEVAAAVSFLCLPGAAYITGQTLAVDGGFSIYGF